MRFPRVVAPGCPHHILHRGNRKQNIFADDSDRLVYLRLMHEAAKKYRTFIWAYALMSNHVHHVGVPERPDSLDKTIRVAHGEYAEYFNAKYGFVGHVWQGRFKSFPMEEEHCWNAVRYVELNPVRAGIVTRAEDYLWSSAAAHCGTRDDLLLAGECPLVLQVPNWSQWLDIGCETTLLEVLRHHTRTCRPLGSNEFLARIGSQLGRDLLPKRRGPRRKPKQPFPLFE